MIKTMNSRITTNSQLSTTEPKNIHKQEQTKQTTTTGTRITEMEITWRVISKKGEEGEWGERYRE